MVTAPPEDLLDAEHPAFRVQTSEAARAFIAVKLTDLDGSAVQALTGAWFAWAARAAADGDGTRVSPVVSLRYGALIAARAYTFSGPGRALHEGEQSVWQLAL